MSSRFERLSWIIYSIYRYGLKIQRDEMERYGYKGSFAQYLSILGHHPLGLTSAQLSELCVRDKAAISRTVREMEEQGLLVRAAAGGNGYRALLILTPKGKKAAQCVYRNAEAAVEAVVGEFTEEEGRILFDVLEKMAAKLQAVSVEGIPGVGAETKEGV